MAFYGIDKQKKEDDRLEKLIKKSNKLYKKHIELYGKVRGFSKPYYIQRQNSLDGGEERELNLKELNMSNFIG